MDILQALKDTYGENRVLNIATFSREGSRSALLSACRGMGIDIDEANYLTTLIPVERGRTKSLSECFFGNNKGEKPVTELVNAVQKHEGLMEISLKIEGIIKNNSVHASGIYIFNNDYTKQNAMMKSSTGLETTQFDMNDSDFMGALKIDALTVSNIDKIRKTLDLLVEDGYIEWQGSLKKTYDRYLHPRVLEYNDPKMWEMVGNNDIPDLFQFDSQVGLQTAQKIEPTNVVELGSANNLMRLMGDGIQPVDKYVMFRDNPELAIAEMDEYQLNDEEKEVIKKHLGEASYVSDSQEEIMLLSMDKKIANFTIVESNDLRKAVAKIDEKVLKRVKSNFFKKGMEAGNRENILQYVWDKQIMPQSGYGFSSLHSSSYSLIALQNMNLASQYPQVYWNTACLTVNSGADETSDSDKGGSYGKVAASIGEMQYRGVKIGLPDINEANFGFKPNHKDNEIIFGLRGIVGIGDEVVHTIIENRPYTSFDDFVTRIFDTKMLQNTHMLQLIKAGSFDSFGDRTDIMKQYLTHVFKPRQKLTLQSFNVVNSLDIIPEDYNLQIRVYNYRQYLTKLKTKKSKDRKTKNRLFYLNDIATEFFFENFTEQAIYDYQENGNPIVAEWLFDKEYEAAMKPLREWFLQDETVDKVNEALFNKEWELRAAGSIPYWEMASLSYYYSGHELDHLDEEKYGVVDYNQLSREPTVVREYEYGGRTRQEFQIYRIAGTVLDKDKNRHTVTLLTKYGVVTVKLYRSNYGYYDRQLSSVNNGKKTVIDKSWFGRGEKLLVTGFRRGNQFVPRVYRDSIYSSTIQKIASIDDEGDLVLISERAKI